MTLGAPPFFAPRPPRAPPRPPPRGAPARKNKPSFPRPSPARLTSSTISSSSASRCATSTSASTTITSTTSRESTCHRRRRVSKPASPFCDFRIGARLSRVDSGVNLRRATHHVLHLDHHGHRRIHRDLHHVRRRVHHEENHLRGDQRKKMRSQRAALARLHRIVLSKLTVCHCCIREEKGLGELWAELQAKCALRLFANGVLERAASS